MTAAAPAHMRIEFFEDGHLYTLNGEERPSVTTIMEAEGLSGSPFYTQRDRDRGHAVHRIAHIIGKRPWRGASVEEIAANSLWDPDRTAPILVPYGMALCKFYLDSGFRPHMVEQPVGSLVWQICGTLDVWGLMPDGERWLIDYKSGEPQPAANIQTAIYEMCLKETLGHVTDKRAVLQLKPDGSYKLDPKFIRPSGGPDLTIGQAAINLYRWRKQNKNL